jgi:hypothetical protein
MIWDSCTLNACRSNNRSGTLVALKRPPGCNPNMMRPSPVLFGLTDATSNVGFVVCASRLGTRRNAGMANTAYAAAIRISLFIGVRLRTLDRYAARCANSDSARPEAPDGGRRF